MGSDPPVGHKCAQQIYFNPRSPDGERPQLIYDIAGLLKISIHAPRMGSDRGGCRKVAFLRVFQSTLPGWGATEQREHGGAASKDFNPRSPDGERLPDLQRISPRGVISIHVPRMGSDHHRRPAYQAHRAISIHVPRMGSDRENGHLRPRYGQNHPFSTLIVSQIVVDVLGTVRKSQKTPAH